jgi:hypothetical protein
MAQQPNVELTEAEKPRATPEPGPATRWRADKPGIPNTPDDVPRGSHFGHAGPDPGWALKLVANADLPDDDDALRDVLTGLVLARAAASGRAPVPEDIEAALVLCGFDPDAPPELVERRKRWLAAAAHDTRPGATAVSEVDRNLIVNKPEQIRYALRLRDKSL